jgi:hypothetical protein
MSHPYVIRSKFATPEDVAEIYGIPKSRIDKIRKIMSGGDKTLMRNDEAAPKTTDTSRGKKRSAGRK